MNVEVGDVFVHNENGKDLIGIMGIANSSGNRADLVTINKIQIKPSIEYRTTSAMAITYVNDNYNKLCNFSNLEIGDKGILVHFGLGALRKFTVVDLNIKNKAFYSEEYPTWTPFFQIYSLAKNIPKIPKIPKEAVVYKEFDDFFYALKPGDIVCMDTTKVYVVLSRAGQDVMFMTCTLPTSTYIFNYSELQHTYHNAFNNDSTVSILPSKGKDLFEYYKSKLGVV